MYFDDSLVQGDTFDLCAEAFNRVAEVLDKLGFTIRPDKSVFAPSKSIELLGFILNSEETFLLGRCQKEKVVDNVSDSDSTFG